MRKLNFRYIFERTRLLLTQPEKIWNRISKEYLSLDELYKFYFIPVAAIASVFILLIGPWHYEPFQTVGLCFINLLAALIGTWLSYLIAKEYLCNKIEEANQYALRLTVYSSAIFTIFHSISTALVNGFLSQLFMLFSLICIRTLYAGIRQIPDPTDNLQTNLLVIISLSIICIPVIIIHILMIVFRIPVLNI